MLPADTLLISEMTLNPAIVAESKTACRSK